MNPKPRGQTEKEGYYDQWCQKQQRGLVGRDMILDTLCACVVKMSPKLNYCQIANNFGTFT